MSDKVYSIGACMVYAKAMSAATETDLGYTSGGVTLRVTTETQKVEADQVMEPLDEFVTSREITVNVPSIIFSLPTLQKAFPGSTLVTDATDETKQKLVVSSAAGVSVADYAMELRLHPMDFDSDDVSHDFFFPKAAVMGNELEINFAKDGLKTITLDFKAYVPTSGTYSGMSLIIGDKSVSASAD